MGWRDDWPSMPDGTEYDGKQLGILARTGNSPFRAVWDVDMLIREIQDNTQFKVADISSVDKGSNNYGLLIRTVNGPDIIARLARGDVNMPGFDGFPVKEQAAEAEFEAAVYRLLFPETDIRASRLLYHGVPVQHPEPSLVAPQDILGRRLFVFKRAEGVNNVWDELNAANKLSLLDQLAHMRVALFRYNPPGDFARQYLVSRLFKFMPPSLSMIVAPIREFWIHVVESKICATIQDLGDMIGWEDDEEVVGPIALTAKQSLLRAIPYLMPQENTKASLYRLVLEHGDFGIHNTSIKTDANGLPLVTSLYDWETAHITPAILSDPLVAAGPVDLITDQDGDACVTRILKDATASEIEIYVSWARHYIGNIYTEAPDYEAAIRAGKDIRYLWFALRDWRGGDSENFFGQLGNWAEKRMRELSV
ncbi:hypothetical protein QQS21_001726 [Conoideocrella luteorostrata]|uniref:Aminoglycoside phosphotransferase domain-containing protein n=1 Tax=Conoideocrella luteorostrata TaxID=1105319 RepID=A0AAJ0G1Q5_9HYPO|nr:hypothetical protein QQS21_001726 [Conoideocrella luteorostrata]